MGNKGSKKTGKKNTATTMQSATNDSKSKKPKPKNPRELGNVQWTYRASDYAAALKQAKEARKPIFMLFQEIPG